MTIIVLVFVVLAAISVGVRTIVRLTDSTFGLDDWLIVAGLECTLTQTPSQIIYIADTGLAVRGVSVGIGSKNDHLNDWMQAESQKFYIVWITIYVVAVALIKSSVCVTLRRIASKSIPILHYAIWALFGLTWASFCVTFFGILTFCRPVEANWNTALVLEGKATCADTETLIGISHTNTATSIVTDVGCIVLPGVLLWKTQMSIKAKIQVLSLLSLASVRIDSHADYIGYIVLFSCVEIGIGCIAASLPALRIMYLRARGKETQASTSTPHANTIVTIGGGKVGEDSSRGQRRVFTNPTDRGTTTTHINRSDSNWERLSDEDSDKGILVDGQNGGIRADYSYSVELEPYKSQRK
ncbi:hypothetical protein NW762_008089 [Fusarium torreyae]|uniref:Rhodopsin domain-containing protein n=1 Tax=Fusarium torreyae TaxID=1237075 RepID=A0A9W8VG95_9HYPO|nr:hypothetical protein NW762_008089 [Fusarium torreyae]